MTGPNPAEESVKHSIRKNGFPEKTVRLPFKPVYEACKKHGASLSDVLGRLREQQIFGKIVGNHVEFRSREKTGFKPPGEGAFPANGFSRAGGGMKGFQEAAKEATGKMTPEQTREIRKAVESMSGEEKQKMLKMFSRLFGPSK